MKKLTRLYKNKGFSYVLTTVLIICAMLLCVAIMEVIRLNVMSAAIRDKYEDAIISVCTARYADMYQPIREGQAATYVNSSGYAWVKSDRTTKAEIARFMSSAMNSGEIAQCTINSIDFTVSNPNYKGTDEKYAIEGTIKVTIPYKFAWSEIAPIVLNLDVKSVWRAKF